MAKYGEDSSLLTIYFAESELVTHYHLFIVQIVLNSSGEGVQDNKANLDILRNNQTLKTIHP